MSETIGVNVLQKAYNVEVSRQLDGYSAVKVYVGTDDDGNQIAFLAGDPSGGQVLEVKMPLVPVDRGQEMADNILESILGYQYQPMSADNALLDPAAEMGDGVTVNGVYSGIFVKATQFGRLMASDIEAPTDEEIEHEFAVESASDRQFTRFVQQTKATIKITATEIRAEMLTKEGGNTETFGWVLTSSGHTWYTGSTPVMKVDANGLKVKGTIEAGTSIGDASTGFTISANAIYKGLQQYGGSQEQGVYIGTDGIQLGQNFSVNTLGNVNANNITLTGTLNIGGATISADTLRQGAQDGYNWSSGGSYGGASSKAAYSLTGGGYGYSYNNATQYGTGSYPSNFTCGALHAKYGANIGSYSLGTQTIYYVDWNGNQRSVLAWTAQR